MRVRVPGSGFRVRVTLMAHVTSSRFHGMKEEPQPGRDQFKGMNSKGTRGVHVFHMPRLRCVCDEGEGEGEGEGAGDGAW